MVNPDRQPVRVPGLVLFKKKTALIIAGPIRAGTYPDREKPELIYGVKEYNILYVNLSAM